MSTTAYNQTYSSSQNLTIPDNARDIYIDLIGGRGGVGGNGGGSRGLSRRGKFLIGGNFVQRSLNLRPGTKGGNGGSGASFGGGGSVNGNGDGGSGASGVWVEAYNCTYTANICTCPVAPGYSCTDSPPCSGGYTNAPNNGCAEGGYRWFCPRTCYRNKNAGAGGGGGAATVVYVSGSIAVVSGGGGGGGGAPGDGNGANTSQFQTGAISSLSGGLSGVSRGSNGGTGGGGGSALGTSKAYNQSSISRYNNSIVTLVTNYGLTASNGTSGNGYVNVQWTALQPEITSFASSSPSLIIGGNPASFTFTFNIIDFVSATLGGPFGTNGASASVTFSPGDTLSYTWTPSASSGEQIDAPITLTAYAGSATDTSSINVDVYAPVVAALSAGGQPDTTAIIIGQSVNLDWQVSGSANTASINQGIGSVSLTDTQSVSPSTTTTYTLSASGPGGSDTDNVIVQVYQIPTLSVEIPTQIDYGDTFTLDTTTDYANTLVSATYTARYLDGSTDTLVVNGSTNATADQSGQITQDLTADIPWGDFGPYEIDVVVAANGSGGNVNQVGTIPVIIDTMPDTMNIPDSRGAIPEDQVESPDEEDVLSDPIEVTGIDIPVEIKANRPIQIRFDDDPPDQASSWKNIRQI